MEDLGNLVIGLDIGTTKVCAVAALIDEQGQLDIKGIGETKPSEGLHKGVISNIELAAQSIQKAIERCESTSGFEIKEVFVGIAGEHIEGKNLSGIVGIRGERVDKYDVDRVIENAKAYNAPDKHIIHVLSQEYIVDGQNGIKNPHGMAGKRLEAKAHIVFASASSVANVTQSCSIAGLEITNIVLEPFSSSLAVLSEDEKEVGTILIDIGGGTTDVVVFKEGSIVHTKVIPMGGSHITKDIGAGMQISKDEATRLKHDKGSALESKIHEDEILKVPEKHGHGKRLVDRKVLAQIIEARFREIFELINKETSKVEHFCASGIVLTGGSSLMPHVTELATLIFDLPVRIGLPRNVKGVEDFVNSPAYATAVGLLRYGYENSQTSFSLVGNSKNEPENLTTNIKIFLKKFF